MPKNETKPFFHDVNYWTDRLLENSVKLNALETIQLPHQTHSIVELHQIRELITSQLAYISLLGETVESEHSRQQKLNFFQRLFNK